MTIFIRPVNDKDYPAIEEKVQEFFSKSHTNTWLKTINQGNVLCAMKDQTSLSALVVEESYLLVLTYNKPWYTNQVFLQELLTQRIYRTNKPFSLVPKALEIIAKDALLKGIMVSAALHPNPEKIFKVYEAAGFERQLGFMFKGVT